MTDPVLIERSELAYIARTAALQVLREYNKDKAMNKPWISQNQAMKLLGRRRLESAMKKGRIRFIKHNPGTKSGRVMILHEDINRLINNP